MHLLLVIWPPLFVGSKEFGLPHTDRPYHYIGFRRDVKAFFPCSQIEHGNDLRKPIGGIREDRDDLSSKALLQRTEGLIQPGGRIHVCGGVLDFLVRHDKAKIVRFLQGGMDLFPGLPKQGHQLRGAVAEQELHDPSTVALAII